MKKIILLLLLSTISIFSFSQDFYKVTQCRIEHYIEDKWVTTQTTYPSKMFVIIKGTTFKVTNEAGSSFQIYGKPEKEKYPTHTTFVWQGYDDEGEQVFLFLKTVGESNTIADFSVMYTNKICYVYSFLEQ